MKMTLNVWAQHSRRVLTGAVVLGALCCSEAWLVVPPRGYDRFGRRWCHQLSSHRDACSRRRAPPLSSSRDRAPPAVSQSANDQAETTGITPSPPPPSVVAAGAGGSKTPGRGVSSWQEQFASLRNDAADPWTCAVEGGSRSTGSNPVTAATRRLSANEDGRSSVQQQLSMDGGVAVGEDLAGVGSPLTATATAAATTTVPEETGRSGPPLYFLSF